MPLANANVLTVTIADGASLSDAAQIGAGTLIGIQLPAIDSASLSFQGSADGVTFVEALDASSVAVAVGASTGSRYIKAPADLAGIPYLKVRSGTSGSPVNQSPAAIITLVVK